MAEATPNAYAALVAMLRVGLAEFAQRTLTQSGEPASPLFQTLREDIDRAWSHDWQALRHELDRHWGHMQGPLNRLIVDLDLAPHEAFLLALAGEMESCHLSNLAVAELQHPVKLERPSCFLAAALVEELFGEPGYNAQDIHSLKLLDHTLLRLEGDGPLPQRTLAMPASLWQILRGKPARWPGCRALDQDSARLEAALLPGKLRDELPATARLLKERDKALLLIRGLPHSGRRTAAGLIAEEIGLLPILIPHRLWNEQPVLAMACPYAGWLPVIEADLAPGETWRSEHIGQAQPMVVVIGQDGAVDHPALIEIDLDVPDMAERRRHWQQHLGGVDYLDQVCSARLTGPGIKAIATSATLAAKRQQRDLQLSDIADARQKHSAEALRLLAQVIRLPLHEDDLVLPPLLAREMEALLQRCRRREQLSDKLGPVLKATLNPGVRALFVGDSGTGKTLAASHLAMRLGAPLYRVDVSAIMNKYVGESEKNVAKLLEQAAACDAVLLFDEADSLFGRRSEARDAGERYANMLTNFLLSRIETHPGIVLLTSNNRNRIDAAFTRRFDAILEFPLPAHQERLLLWHKHLGDSAPSENTCAYLASYCDLGGGHIRNAVLNASVHADEQGIQLGDIVHGLENEYRKLGRSLPQSLAALCD